MLARLAGPLAALALACGNASDRGDVVAPAGDVAAPSAPAPAPPKLVRTCPVHPPTPRPLQLDAVSELDPAAGKSWIVATRADQSVLLHLDPTGELATTPIPTWSETVAAEPAALRIANTLAPPQWWTLDLRDPDHPTPGPAAAIDPAAAGEYPKAFASDGTRALLAQYRVADAGPRRYIGSTYFLDVATGRPLTPPAAMTVWIAHCDRGRCQGYATDNATDHAVIAGFDDAGHRILHDLGTQTCAGVTAWQQGRQWLLAWSEQGAFGVASVDLDTRDVRTARVSVPDSANQCTSLDPLTVAGHHGLLVGSGTQRSFFESLGDRSFGPPEPLPPLEHTQLALASFGDGVLLAQYAARTGMVHGPEENGIREYHHVWSFTGRHDLLRRDAGAWQLEAGGPLPHDGEHGEHSDGYRVHLLTRPDHAGVLVSGGRSLASAYLPLRSACP